MDVSLTEADKMTLYLVNDHYKKKLKKTKESTFDLDSITKDNKFYKNRLRYLFNKLCEGEKVNDSIDEYFMQFAREAVKYFKVKDRNDILQNEYKELYIHDISNCVIQNTNKSKNDISLNDPGENDYCAPIKNISTLDTYVRYKNKTNKSKIDFIPKIKKIDISTEYHKTKDT